MMLALKIWFKAAWEWLKKYWKWLIFPIGIGIWVIARATAKKEITVVSPGLVAHEEVKAQLDAQAAQQKATADVKAVSELNRIETERSTIAANETQKHIDEIEDVQGDPKKVTDLLKNIGKDIREGKR